MNITNILVEIKWILVIIVTPICLHIVSKMHPTIKLKLHNIKIKISTKQKE